MTATTPTATHEALERLEREIRAVRNTVLNRITVREEHPSYGVTKAAIRQELDRLIGLCEAWLYVSGRWDFAGAVLWAGTTIELVEAELGINVRELNRRASAVK